MTNDATTTADLMDDPNVYVESCEIAFRQYGARRAFSGPIATVRCDNDNVLARAALAEPGRGRVLVIDGGGSLHSALVGDEMATLGQKNGWVGIVVYGAVRDVAMLRHIDIGLKAVGSNPRRSTKGGAGERDVVLSFGDAHFRPGSTLSSDDDGIVVAANR